MRFLMTVLVLAVGLALLLGTRTAAAQPELVSNYPADGDVLNEPPAILQLCFKEPVNILDLDKGGDFRFSVMTPAGQGLGLRIVFQPDGLGVGIHPGYPTPPLEGEWTFNWRVTEPQTLEPASGTIKFTVSPDGSPLPDKAPTPCGGTPFPDVTPEPGSLTVDEDDGGTSTLLVVIIAAAALGGAALLVLLVVRRRRG